jgi:acetyl-CoA acetyltransferase
VIYGLESYGFCDEGEALDFVRDGHIELNGELPLNTFGGSLGTGRIHGLWHIIEGALQASGRAGSRQHPSCAAAHPVFGPRSSDGRQLA